MSSESATALIGHSGFVGGTLLRQRPFTHRYRSTDIADIAGREFDLVVCAGAPAVKWKANKEPEADRAALAGLMSHLSTVRAKRFILISTVDVYPRPVEVDEDTPIDHASAQPYGRHRRELELFVQERFPLHHIVRLPGLVGPGLKKNVIFDFRHGNNLHAIDHRGVFQFYPMVNLWADLQRTIDLGLPLVNLAAEPVSVAAVAADGFGLPFANELAAQPGRYDLRSRHAAAFGGRDGYQYSRRETLLAIRAYAQSEPALAPVPA